MPEPNLGERLKSRLDREKTDGLARLTRVAGELSQAERDKLEAVKAFFVEVQSKWTQAILADKSLPRIVLGKGENSELCSILCTYQWSGKPNSGIADRHHRYFPVWENFSAWARDNGLRPEWKYEHDGVGIESWHALVVEPLKA